MLLCLVSESSNKVLKRDATFLGTHTLNLISLSIFLLVGELKLICGEISEEEGVQPGCVDAVEWNLETSGDLIDVNCLFE